MGLVGVLRPPADDSPPAFETGEARVLDGVRSDSGFGGANFRMLSLRARGLLPPATSSSKWTVNAMELEPDACVWDAGVSGHGDCSSLEGVDWTAESPGDVWTEPFPSRCSFTAGGGGGGARSLPGECRGLQASVVGLEGGGLRGNTSLTVLTESSVLLRSSRESASCITGDDSKPSFPALGGELGDTFWGLPELDPE